VLDAASVNSDGPFHAMTGTRIEWRGQLSERLGSVLTPHTAGIGDGMETLVIRPVGPGVWETMTTARVSEQALTFGSGFDTLAEVLEWGQMIYTRTVAERGGRVMRPQFAVGQLGTDQPAPAIVAW
jgi:hypothetical protein